MTTPTSLNAQHTNESNEEQDKPVREQLKKTSIHAMDNPTKDVSADDTPAVNGTKPGSSSNGDVEEQEAETRGRLHRKRSHEEIDGESKEESLAAQTKQHTRKRSRDSTAEEDELNNGQRKTSSERTRDAHFLAAVEAEASSKDKPADTIRPTTPEQADLKRTEPAAELLASPKTKKSRLAGDGSIASTVAADTAIVSTDETKDTAKDTAKDVKETDSKATSSSIPPGSGFANTSATSPFGSVGTNKSSTGASDQSSASAFAASGFGALASSSTSGFGAVGKSTGGFGTGGSFATGKKGDQSSKDGEKSSFGSGGGFASKPSAPSTFGSAKPGAFGAGQSGFASLGSGIGGGFGSSGGFGSLAGAAKGGLASFASGKPGNTFGSGKPLKPFGAPLNNDDDDDDDGNDDDDGPSGAKSPLSGEEEKQDERFYEQDLETGEEGETIEYSCRAKLYNFAAGPDGKKEWKERGLGMLRLNVKEVPVADGSDLVKLQARVLMRADGSHRVVLNSPVKKELKFGAPTGGPPQGGYIYFMGAFEGKSTLELLQLKLRQSYALDLYEKITEVQSRM